MRSVGVMSVTNWTIVSNQRDKGLNNTVATTDSGSDYL